jgi:hypothetical protein
VILQYAPALGSVTHRPTLAMAASSRCASRLMSRERPRGRRAPVGGSRLVRVLGRSSGLAAGLRQAAHAGLPKGCDLAGQLALSEISLRLGRQEFMPDGRGQHDHPGRRAATSGLDALERIGGVKDEGARHRGQRKVEGNVDKDYHEQCPPTVHAPHSTPMATTDVAAGRQRPVQAVSDRPFLPAPRRLSMIHGCRLAGVSDSEWYTRISSQMIQ